MNISIRILIVVFSLYSSCCGNSSVSRLFYNLCNYDNEELDLLNTMDSIPTKEYELLVKKGFQINVFLFDKLTSKKITNRTFFPAPYILTEGDLAFLLLTEVNNIDIDIDQMLLFFKDDLVEYRYSGAFYEFLYFKNDSDNFYKIYVYLKNKIEVVN